MEIIRKEHVDSVQDGFVGLIQPNKHLQELEKKFRFTDTFTNRVALADAYLKKGYYEKAIELYEPALTGIFHQNMETICNLVIAYYHVEKYAEIVTIVQRIIQNKDFPNMPAHYYYTIALEQLGRNEEAENEYKKKNVKYTNYPSRCNYADFLLRNARKGEAMTIYQDIINETLYMKNVEKKNVQFWINKAKEGLKSGGVVAK